MGGDAKQQIIEWSMAMTASHSDLDKEAVTKALEYFGPEKVAAFQALIEEWLELNRASTRDKKRPS